MTRSEIDRRTFVRHAAAGAGALTIADVGFAQSQSSQLVERQPPLTAMLPNTRYFEVDSRQVGGRFGVWVTTPPTYERTANQRFPAIYLPDGNLAAPQTAASLALLPFDPIHPIRPFIEVCVGYAGDEAARMLAVRARDLLPPGEPLLPGTNESSMAALVQLGMLDQVGADLYLRNLRNPAADRFLGFLTEELHPLIASRYRVEPDSAGLFGYSYGGLFATYVALRRTSLFRRIGAGSPGILPRVSKIFSMYRENLEAEADHAARMLHMTVCGPELTAPSAYQPLVGAGTVEFITTAGQTPLKGLAFSSRVIEYESHASGFVPSWFSFLRTCYSAKG
jgi:predicted alpha/beta superfamily hydrolase